MWNRSASSPSTENVLESPSSGSLTTSARPTRRLADAFSSTENSALSSSKAGGSLTSVTLTTTSTEIFIDPAAADNSVSYSLSRFPSFGFSKFLADLKRKAPASSMDSLLASVPSMDQEMVASGAAFVTRYVAMAVVLFSGNSTAVGPSIARDCCAPACCAKATPDGTISGPAPAIAPAMASNDTHTAGFAITRVNSLNPEDTRDAPACQPNAVLTPH